MTALTPSFTKPPAIAPQEVSPVPTTQLITRALTLQDGRAYAAAWLGLPPPPSPAPPERRRLFDLLRIIRAAHAGKIPMAFAVMLTRDMADERPGEPQPPPPDEPPVPTLVLVRDDGALSQPPDISGPEVALGLPAAGQHPVFGALSLLPSPRHWSFAGLQAYCAGQRPSPADVLQRLIAVLDHFMNFTGSPGGHNYITHFLAAYILTTWFQPAFTTFSPLWIVGPPGSGKSRLLHLLSRLCHFGLVVSPFTSHRHLYALASLGASLAVDNADAVFPAQGHSAAPLRPANAAQSVLLAGARRGIFHSNPHSPGRPVNFPPVDPAAHLAASDLFGPRLYAARFVPHPELAASAIVLPLEPSADISRTAYDPESPQDWPCDPAALTDDLWALALASVSQMPAHLSQVAALSMPAFGPGDQPHNAPALALAWRPVFAVAAWLAGQGVPNAIPGFRELATRLRHHPPPSPATQLAVIALHALHRLVCCRQLGFLAPPLPPPPDPSPKNPADDSNTVRIQAHRSPIEMWAKAYLEEESNRRSEEYARQVDPLTGNPLPGTQAERDHLAYIAQLEREGKLNPSPPTAHGSQVAGRAAGNAGNPGNPGNAGKAGKAGNAGNAGKAGNAGNAGKAGNAGNAGNAGGAGLALSKQAFAQDPTDDHAFNDFFDILEMVSAPIRLTPALAETLSLADLSFRPAALVDLMTDTAHRLGLGHLVARLTPNSVGHVLGAFGFHRRRDEAGTLYTFPVHRLNALLRQYGLDLPPLPDQRSLDETRAELARLPTPEDRLALLYDPDDKFAPRYPP